MDHIVLQLLILNSDVYLIFSFCSKKWLTDYNFHLCVLGDKVSCFLLLSKSFANNIVCPLTFVIDAMLSTHSLMRNRFLAASNS